MAPETCSQRCSNGTIMGGYGSTVDEAFQDMNGCGSVGGGSIECWSSNDM
ncbi:MAG: hypothetical protein WKG01_16080 [Kofleriaceae bacterium]